MLDGKFKCMYDREKGSLVITKLMYTVQTNKGSHFNKNDQS